MKTSKRVSRSVKAVASTVSVWCLVAATPADAALLVPQFNSLPDAHAQIYLDFTGASNFGSWNGRTVGQAPAYDIDGDPTSFSGLELSYIRQIFIRVAEKFSPFNINVTTVDPGNRNSRQTAHIMISGDGAWYSTTAVGGVAMLGGFYNVSSNTAWVFPDNLGNGNPKFVAEAAAHEAGHLFGLSHQASYSQNAQGEWVRQEYSTNGDDPKRRPVMGSSYGSERGLWWYGTTSSRTTFQDNLAVLTNSSNGFGYRPDDHGNTLATATPLTADETGAVTPIAGIISTNDDMDMFSFQTGTGTVSFWMTLAEYGAMLDATLRLFDGSGQLLQIAATANLAESLVANLAAGEYWLGVSGAGGYGDLGQYTLMGQLVPVANPDAVPEPSGMVAMLLVGAGCAIRRRRTATTDAISA